LTEKTFIRRPSARAAEKRDRIGEAVLSVLAEHGIAKLTHRRVAQAAGVPIAATTYHYATKADMLADAFERLLGSYLEAFERVADRHRRGGGIDQSLDDLVTRIVINAAGRHRTRTLAWCELMLDAARTPSGHLLASQWFADLERAWTKLAGLFGSDQNPVAIHAAIDLSVGLIFVTLALGLDPDQARALREGSPVETLASAGSDTATQIDPAEKAGARSAILESAIKLLVEFGPGEISYRTVAAGADVAQSAPAYYFGSIEQLIRASEAKLFEAARARYRETTANLARQPSDVDDLADATVAVLIHEATDHRQASLAHYSIWIEAARSASLRPEVSRAIIDQAAGWHRRLLKLHGHTAETGINIQALFVGRLVRLLATQPSMPDMIYFRRELLYALQKIGDVKN
jgi:AcrR family transcriptional regulator